MLVHFSGRELHVSTLKRNVLRFEPGCQERLDEIAELAGTVLQCDVSRAAVVRAAVQGWLTSNAHIHPDQLVAAIRAAMVKRGRKRHTVR
jgi:hypothetical protein